MTGDKDAHHVTTFSLPVKADTFFGKCWWSDEVFLGSQQGYRDFVLISEFSEMEGPVPLAVVSESTYVDLKEYTAPSSSSSEQQAKHRLQMEADLHTLGLDRFDFNAFALRVVSTDRGADCYDQANLDRPDATVVSNTPATPSSLLDQTTTKDHIQQGLKHDDLDTSLNSSSNDDGSTNTTQSIFSIPDDTQVYFNDSDLKLYSFTHHLTLFDINARGYVHPVALSYITRDTEKIVSRFEDFMNRFNEVSRLMKKGNYANFMLDLKYRLLDLEYTERTLSKSNSPPQTAGSDVISDSNNEKTVLVTSSDINSACLTLPGSDKTSPLSADQPTPTSTIEYRGAPSSSPQSMATNTKDQHATCASSLPTPTKQHTVPTIDTDIASTPPLKDRSKPLDQGPATAPVTRKECLSTQALHQAQTVTRLMLDTMDTYATQWIRTSYDGETSEDVSTDLDEDSPISPTLLYDKHQIVESPQVVEPAKDYQPKYVDTLYPVAHFDRKLRSLSQLCHEPDRHQLNQQRRRSSNSGQSHRSLPSTSVIPLVSIIEPQRRKTNKGVKRRLFDKSTKHDMYTEAIKYISDLTAELGRSSVALELESEDNQLLEPVSQVLSFGRVFMLNLEDVYSRHESSSPSSRADEYDDFKSPSNLHPLSSTHAQTTTPISTSSAFTEDLKLEQVNQESSHYYAPLWPTAQLWESKQKQSYGDLLRLLEKHKQYIHHVIYSLLTGRSVVVIGHPDGKSRIQEIIQALSIFVPGLSKQRHQIVPWYNSEKLKDESLSTMKLVGTAIENVDPSVYRMDISCLEVDHENGSGHLITSPLYLEGQWIYRMLSKIPTYTVDESYIGYLHTIFMEMSLLAYLYYHKYIVETDTEEWDDVYGYPASTTSFDTRYASKVGQHSSTTSHNGSPSEDHRQQLSKKWSVRRIMNYLKRVEDGGEPDDYFGSAGAFTSANSTANTSPNLAEPPATSNSLLSSSSSTTTTISTSSTRTSTSVGSSSESSSPSSASSMLQQRLSAVDDPANLNRAPYVVSADLLHQSEATTHQNHRQSHRSRQNDIPFQHTDTPHPHHQQTHIPSIPLQQEETSSDHFSEENEATVTLDSIQNQPHPSVLQLNWDPPSSQATTDKLASSTTTTASPPSSQLVGSAYDMTLPDGSSRRTSEAFSQRSIHFPSSLSNSTSTSRRNSSSNTSTSQLSTNDDDFDNDTNAEPWRDFNTELYLSSSSSSGGGGDGFSVGIAQQRRTDQEKQQKLPTSRKRLDDGGGLTSSQSQSDTRSWTSERRGQTFLEQTFHVLGDDQAIVMYLASMHRDF